MKGKVGSMVEVRGGCGEGVLWKWVGDVDIVLCGKARYFRM